MSLWHRMVRTIVHVDMDAFYAAIEQRDHAELRGKPVVVGADPRGGGGRGVVSTASYEARKFGIRSAMPVSTAYKLCPEAVFVPPDFSRYEEASNRIMECLGLFSPLVEQVSIDEAFMDCTGTEKLFGNSADLGRKIKEAIHSATGLTASAGIATNKSIAKIASDFNKPDGLTIVSPGHEEQFLTPLPVEKIWGVGPKTALRLRQLGYQTVGDIVRAPREEIVNLLGAWGAKIHDLAHGKDERPVASGWQRKSISEETTFDQDTDDLERLELTLGGIAERLAGSMIREKIRGRTLHFKIRLTGFETYSRSHTQSAAVCDMKSLRSFAVEELRRFDRHGKKVRLIGIGVSELERGEPAGQMDLFAQAEDKSAVDKLVVTLQDKFHGKVKRLSSTKAPERKV